MSLGKISKLTSYKRVINGEEFEMFVNLSKLIRCNNRTVFGSIVNLSKLKVYKRVINRTVFGSLVNLVKKIQKSDK